MLAKSRDSEHSQMQHDQTDLMAVSLHSSPNPSPIGGQILIQQETLKGLVPEMHPEILADRNGNDRSLGSTKMKIKMFVDMLS